MDIHTPLPVTDDELHALLDGRLTVDERTALLGRLEHDPRAGETLAAWRMQRDGLYALHREVLDDRIPDTLLRAARETGGAQARASQWWRLGGIAAGLLLAFAAGWLGSQQWQTSQGRALAQARPYTPRDFAHAATVAHAVYSPEVRHPVEVAAAQQEHLVQWLSKRLGRPLKVPQLGAQGYELVGGRLLPGESGARAQFMFQNAGGERVTLYLGSVSPAKDAAAKDAPNTMETAFSFTSDGPVPGFYWVDRGFGYALSGQLPREQLLKLAEAVFQQL